MEEFSDPCNFQYIFAEPSSTSRQTELPVVLGLRHYQHLRLVQRLSYSFDKMLMLLFSSSDAIDMGRSAQKCKYRAFHSEAEEAATPHVK